MGLSLPQKYASTKKCIKQDECCMAQLFLFAYGCIKSSARSINWNRLNTPFPHPSYIPFISISFFSLSPLPFQSLTGTGFMFHFLRIRYFWLSHTWLPVKIILATSLFMVIRYLPFFPCLQSEIDGFYQNIYSQTFIEQNQERNTKGTVHEIPGIFCCRNCVCIYYCCRQPENFPGKLNSGSNSQACRR